MNKDQRKFLNDFIEKEGRKLDAEHRQRRPKEPSLNNYLIAAILDGSFILLPQETMRERFHQRVLNLGPGDQFIEKSGWSHREGPPNSMLISVHDIFVIPEAYLIEYDKFQEAYVFWEKEGKQLEELRKTLSIKVQIGSDKALAKLVEQADNLGDLRLVNSRLLLTDETT